MEDDIADLLDEGEFKQPKIKPVSSNTGNSFLNLIKNNAKKVFDSPIQTNEQNEEKYFKCNLILNLNAFDDLRKELIIENSLIVIGTIGEMTEYNSSSNNYNLPEDSSYTIVTLKQVDYVIGFPGEELLFRNYNIISDDDDE